MVITSLLYACESWTTYSRHLKKLNHFHFNCLRRLVRTRWQDKVPHTEILQRSGMTSVSTMVMKAQLRWSGHVVRMPGNRFPQKIFYGELVKGKRLQGGQRKRYKDCLKSTLKLCNIDVDNWERIAQDRKSWCKVVSSGPSGFEARRINDAETKRCLRKSRQQDIQSAVPNPELIYSQCGRRFHAIRIGLISHAQVHKKP